ncbi:MAG: UDP-N-acetylmuramoyl-L-alanine--D-glutamate ligase [Lachnospiraceae bacterium]|nr:UDP-N-acetylmuramoyl-L-alanine--D-glutamate ligase [Lachnospiraceae bacterium]
MDCQGKFFHKNDLFGKKVLIMGTGISGIAAAKLLDGISDITLYDANENLDAMEIRGKIKEDFRGRIVLGEFRSDMAADMDYVVLSPGVPADLPEIDRLRDPGAKIIGEVELAYQFERGHLLAITGTNGKTTTTALTGEIIKTFYKDVFVVGNIGVPYTEMVLGTSKDSVTVAEVSSFQLETIKDFRPFVSAITNITPDHLNRHHTMENYVSAKLAIARNQTMEDICILNYEDGRLRAAGEKLACKVIWFSSERKLSEGFFLSGDEIIYVQGGQENVLVNVNELNIIGRHNYENVMVAAAAAMALSIPVECIRRALRAFRAVEHRIEYVAEKNGVKYYNDSKGTNPDASIKAVRAMTAKTFLIGGGYDKGSEYGEWIDSFEDRIKCLVLMGQTREKIAQAAREKGFHNIVLVGGMEEAVNYCQEHAQPGDAVLLSPCCASWGMFKNYEERGRIFKELVLALP